MATGEHLEQRLREAGLRVTAPRRAIFAALPDGRHLGVEAIAQSARRELGSLSTQAVYDTLHTFAALGLVRRVEPAGSPALFETRVGDNHHHVACRACGAVADVDCAVGERPCLEPSHAAGYVVDEAEVTFWGFCPTCQPTITPDPSGVSS